MIARLTRIWAVLMSIVDRVLDRVETPQQLYANAIQKSTDSYTTNRDRVCNAVTSAKILEAKVTELRRQSKELRESASTLKQRGDDDLALSAVKQALAVEDSLKSVEAQSETTTAIANKMRAQLLSQETELQEAITKAKAGIVLADAAAIAKESAGTLSPLVTGLDAANDSMTALDARATAELELAESSMSSTRDSVRFDITTERARAELEAL